MHNYKNLQVWQLAMDLAEHVYVLSASFPSDERFGLISQIRRSAVSIASNIAEGSGRGSDKDFSRFLNIALGSAFELETQIMLAHRLKFTAGAESVSIEKLNQVQKMIHNLIKRLEPKS